MWHSKVVIKCSGHISDDRNGRLGVHHPLANVITARPACVYGEGNKEYYEILCLHRRSDEVITLWRDDAKYSS